MKKTFKHWSLAFTLFTIILANFEILAQKTPAKKPNIIIIMADDLGYSDIGCFGGEINTPNIDRLAKNGLRMTNFYNNARCCPTRASLLTGQYAHKVGLSINGNALTKNGATIAEILKENGYQTGMVGKWHLSDDITKPSTTEQLKWLSHQAYPNDNFASVESYPINRGFQKHYGIIWGVIDYFDPFSLVDGEKNVQEVPKDYYITEAINQKSVEYIQEFSKKKDPYFMYVAHTAPHWPLHARPEDIAKYKGKYDMGWDELRKQRYARMVKLGLINPKVTKLIDVDGRNPKWEKLTAQEKEFHANKMATHAAMIEKVDTGVGQILAELERTHTLDNTLIFFLADNGASPEIPTNPGYDRPGNTRAGIPMKYDKELSPNEIGSEISYTGIGSNWANAANTPYRFWKLESFEGGIHTPMIVHWAGLKTAKGSKAPALAHVFDILPTILDITQTPYPASYKGNALTPLDGKSFLPVLQGKTQKGREDIFFEHESGKAYIKGDWKLVQKTRSNQWELYNLSADRNETENLAEKDPSKTAEMQKAWEGWYSSLKPYIKPRPGSGPR
ncbi:arylsulfatase [Cellulophaga sp. BC115SP]|uniref:arylsulfatase n=1 Tax=Cellulophaga sp. BC115SP TaxID=2683263 RepID=UPI001412DD52|nr:arylsulfatase [Cellulophaga sp. BC115SP]NBB29890.1 sulfatase-like hydrolase/transferase [Cellulophaga sp. BC115SP]